MKVKILKYAQALYTKRKGAKTRRRKDFNLFCYTENHREDTETSLRLRVLAPLRSV